jgi:hypothetical protein
MRLVNLNRFENKPSTVRRHYNPTRLGVLFSPPSLRTESGRLKLNLGVSPCDCLPVSFTLPALAASTPDSPTGVAGNARRPGVTICPRRRAAKDASLRRAASASSFFFVSLASSSRAITSFSSFRRAFASFKLLFVSLTEKNMGPALASQCGSTALTHCMYSGARETERVSLSDRVYIRDWYEGLERVGPVLHSMRDLKYCTPWYE